MTENNILRFVLILINMAHPASSEVIDYKENRKGKLILIVLLYIFFLTYRILFAIH
jgi:hypothetical protein